VFQRKFEFLIPPLLGLSDQEHGGSMSDWIGIKQESEIYRLEKRLSWDEVNLLLDLLFKPWFFEFNLLSSL
jgi:hypothetical protein